MASEARFAEYELTVERNLEATVISRLQLDAPKYRRPARQYLLSQAHGPVEIVSRDTELDYSLVLWVDHWYLTRKILTVAAVHAQRRR